LVIFCYIWPCRERSWEPEAYWLGAIRGRPLDHGSMKAIPTANKMDCSTNAVCSHKLLLAVTLFAPNTTMATPTFHLTHLPVISHACCLPCQHTLQQLLLTTYATSFGPTGNAPGIPSRICQELDIHKAWSVYPLSRAIVLWHSHTSHSLFIDGLHRDSYKRVY